MPSRLRKLRIKAVALVDHGANYDVETGEGAHVLLYKRADELDDMPALDDETADDYGKRDYSPASRESMASRGQAMAGGRYPIANVQDLRNAIRAYGRGAPADKPSIKRHIMRRARALGRSDLIPEDWKVRKDTSMDGAHDDYDDEMISMPDDILQAREAREAYYKVHDAFMESFACIMREAPTSDQPKLLQEAVKQFGAQIGSIVKSVRPVLDDAGQEALDAVEGLLSVMTQPGVKAARKRLQRFKEAAERLYKSVQVEQAEEEEEDEMPGKVTDEQYDAMKTRAEAAETAQQAAQAQIAELTKRAETAEGQVSTLEASQAAVVKEVAGLKAKLDKSQAPDVPEEQIWKGASPQARAEYEALKKKAEDNEELAKAEKDRRERQEYITEVKKFDHLPMHADDDWQTLRDIDRSLPETSRERVLALLKVANELGKRAKVLKTIGVDGKPTIDDETAEARITKMSRDLVTKGEAKNFTEALTLINQTNPLLYQEYRDEQRNMARRNFVDDDA